MPKMKSHSGAKKRFKKTATGKLQGRHAFSSHILEKKSPKRKREMAHPERGEMILNRLAEDLADLAVVEQRPQQDGRNMTMMLGPARTTPPDGAKPAS